MQRRSEKASASCETGAASMSKDIDTQNSGMKVDDGGRKARSIALITSSELSHTGLYSENSGTWVRQTMVTEHRSWNGVS